MPYLRTPLNQSVVCVVRPADGGEGGGGGEGVVGVGVEVRQGRLLGTLTAMKLDDVTLTSSTSQKSLLLYLTTTAVIMIFCNRLGTRLFSKISHQF